MDAQFFFVQYTASLGPGIMIGKLYRTNVSFADVVFSRGKFQIDIPLAGFNACGKLQVEFRRNSCAGIPLVCIGINSYNSRPFPE